MPQVSVPRERIVDGSLLPVCVVCGAEAHHRLYPRVSAPSLAWILFSPLIGLLTFWSYILLARRVSKVGSAGLPFCDQHRSYWPRRAWFVVAGFVILVSLIVAAAFLAPTAAPDKKGESHWLFVVLGCWMLGFLPAFIIIHLTSMRPTGGNRKSLVLSGASREFVAAVEGESRRGGVALTNEGS